MLTYRPKLLHICNDEQETIEDEDNREMQPRMMDRRRQCRNDCTPQHNNHDGYGVMGFLTMAVLVAAGAGVLVVCSAAGVSGTGVGAAATFVHALSLSKPSLYSSSSEAGAGSEYQRTTTTMSIQPTSPHFLIPPRKTRIDRQTISNVTLREFLTHPDGFHLGMAPSFFGFYGYFGALAGIEEELFPGIVNGTIDNKNKGNTTVSSLLPSIVKSVAGASAGAMAAIMLAAGVSPLVAAEFCTTITLDRFADFPGLLSVFRGDRFEEIMNEFLMETSPVKSLRLEDSIIPVAVSAFDIQKLKGNILSTGSMARAARASATFPGLFQPVGWIDSNTGDSFVFIDGGITDVDGLNGLKATFDSNSERQIPRRVVNLVVGDFQFSTVPGPSSIDASSVVSISIRNLPPCGPWAMENGLRAVEAARKALKASLDHPLFLSGSGEDGHYELHIDTRSFIPDP